MQPVRRLMLECGPSLVRRDKAGEEIKAKIAETRAKFGLELSVLLYDREHCLYHTNDRAGAAEAPTARILYLTLNNDGLPFNLALNGSPDHTRSVPLLRQELDYLRDLEMSGRRSGVRNAVTIADNALVPGIRRDFPGLEVIGSCLSVCFEPNLVSFGREHGVTYDDPLFLVKYYRHLYSLYDRVVPLPQLISPAFLFALDLTRETLSTKTILFLNLGCGAPAIGFCAGHYWVRRDEILPGFPVIPKQFLAKPEDRLLRAVGGTCIQYSDSLELQNRFADLRAFTEAGIYQFKVPAREFAGTLSKLFQFLCRFMAKSDPPGTFPEKAAITGRTRVEMKTDFISNYPSVLHGILGEFEWPGYDAGGCYWEDTAAKVHGQLHSRAAALWQSLRPGT